jgi:hypothetical protein
MLQDIGALIPHHFMLLFERIKWILFSFFKPNLFYKR